MMQAHLVDQVELRFEKIDVPFLRFQYFVKQVATDVVLVRLAVVPDADVETLLGQHCWIPLFFAL